MTDLEILTIGDELTEGSRTNTNAAWLAETLTEAGAKIKKITTTGDDPSLISNEIRRVIKGRVNLLITTGGLGPTPDDRTLEALSKALGKKQTLDEDALRMVEESYSRLAKEGAVKKEGLIPARKRMAKLPEGSDPIPNPVGGAPAVLAEKKKTKILCLPGVPREMKTILKQNLDMLELQEPEETKNYRMLEVKGIEESSLASIYNKVKGKFPEVEIRSYPSGLGAKGKVNLKLAGKNEKNLSEAEKLFRKLVEDLSGAKIE